MKKNILFVSHDANRAGAQIFLYNMMSFLQDRGYGVTLLLIHDWGSFKGEFESKFKTYSLQQKPMRRWERMFHTPALEEIKKKEQVDLLYVNTIASVHVIPELKKYWNVPVISHIHELSYSIAQYGVPNAQEILFDHSDKVVACSRAVAENLLSERKSNKVEVIHSFVQNERILEIHQKGKREEVLKSFDLDSKYTWVCACGNADWRKAPDIFLQIASKVRNENIRFAWIGISENDPLMGQLAYDAKKLDITHKVKWISPTPRAVELINAMDVFLLSSREDPFPLVMLEAALCKKPIFTFKNTGGGDEFVEEDAGVRIDYLQVEAMANAIDSSIPEDLAALGKKAQEKVLAQYSFETSMKKMEKLIELFF
jgi:glycosyltransferase involved in cell wall biosynthesis